MTRDIETLRRRHERLQADLARAEESMEAANTAYSAHVPNDPGILSGVGGRSWGKGRDALSRRQGRAWEEWDRLRKVARRAESAYKQALEDASTAKTVDIDRIRPGDLVRIQGRGWHKVRRVNAKTITCHVPAPFDPPRYTHDRVVEHKEVNR